MRGKLIQRRSYFISPLSCLPIFFFAERGTHRTEKILILVSPNLRIRKKITRSNTVLANLIDDKSDKRERIMCRFLINDGRSFGYNLFSVVRYERGADFRFTNV